MARILNVISGISPTSGTPAKLRALMKASRHEHYLYHPGYESNRAIIEKEIPFYETIGVKAYFGIHNRNIFYYAKDLHGIIKENNIDIVNFYFNFENLVAPLIKLMDPNVKIVRSIVGFEQKLPWWREWIMYLAFKSVDHFIFISNYVKYLYETTYPVLRNRHSLIIYNGPINVKKNMVAMKEKYTLVSTGGLCQRKNMMVLIETMRVVKHDYKRTDLHLYILGDGNERNMIEKAIEDMDVIDMVTLVGATNNVADYLDECAIYVHPATTEGFGIAVVEAMQMKCACVVSNKGALPELVKDDVNGFIVDAYDPQEWAEKIIYLKDHPEMRIHMGEESFKIASEKFSLSSFIENHDCFYDKLLYK